MSPYRIELEYLDRRTGARYAEMVVVRTREEMERVLRERRKRQPEPIATKIVLVADTGDAS